MIIDFFNPAFPYVDVSFKSIKNKWTRMSFSQAIEQFRRLKPEEEGYMSIQHYQNSVPSDSDERHIGMLSIDIDSENNLKKALVEARKVYWFLHDVLEIDDPWPRVFFSGNKGFHLDVHPDFLGAKPTDHMNQITKMAAEQISLRTEVSTIDDKIYSRRRLFRLEDTYNEKSGLYKVELDLHSFLNWDIKQIKEFAKKPRRSPPYDPEEYLNVSPTVPAKKFWDSLEEIWAEKQEVLKLKPKAPIKIMPITKDDKGKEVRPFPECIKHLNKYGAPGGQLRNRCTMILASFYKDQGYDRDTALELCLGWLETHYDPRHKKHKERLSNTHAVVRTVYEADYHHICAYVAGTHTWVTDDKGNKKKQKIKCIGSSNCKWIEKEEDQSPERLPTTSLSKAGNGIYHNMRIKVPVHVLQRYEPGYQLPQKVSFRCKKPDGAEDEGENKVSICDRCSMKDTSIAEWEPDINQRSILNLIEVKDEAQRLQLKKIMGVPKRCANCWIEEQGSAENVFQVDIAPMVEITGSDSEEFQGDYTVRHGYYLGDDISPNEKYYATLKTTSDPRTQQAVHLIESIEPARSSLDKFSPSADLLKNLRVFQVPKGQSLEQKFHHIHDDLEANITKAFGRRLVAIVADLVWHSVLKFRFREKVIKKGWLEGLIFGDAGQGKNMVVEAMMEHYRLGELIGGEGATRQGLTYSATKRGEHWFPQWGRIVQCHRGLLIIDEMSGIPMTEMQKLTRVRSEGVVEAQGVISGHEAKAHTRLIFLSNPRGSRDSSSGLSMSDYNYGIEAFRALYPEPADRRRVDIAVAVCDGDIKAEDYNYEWRGSPRPHVYTTDLCHNLILWAWTRRQSQVRFTKDAEVACGEVALRMAKKYGTKDIELVKKSDQANKVARVAAAIAARVFSTDENYQNLLVDIEHVLFAEKVFSMVYDDPSMEYNIYASKFRRENEQAEELQRDVEKIFRSVAGQDNKRYIQILNYFAVSDVIAVNDCQHILNLEKEAFSKLFMMLTSNSLIKRRKSYGYEKLATFKKIIKQLDKGAKY